MGNGTKNQPKDSYNEEVDYGFLFSYLQVEVMCLP